MTSPIGHVKYRAYCGSICDVNLTLARFDRMSTVSVLSARSMKLYCHIELVDDSVVAKYIGREESLT
jgi:hypothetical protein